MLLLLVGPMVEEFYGSGRLLLMCAITAVVTGLVDMVFSPPPLCWAPAALCL